MSIIEEYWEGIVDRLQAEVNVLSRLIDHAGERGRENEQALQRILERFLPRTYGLGTGMIIDSAGNYSKQMDLVIFDQQHHPTWLGQTTLLLHPVETVYAVVEVKTTLRTEDIDDIGRKCRSIRELKMQDEGVIAYRSSGDAIQMGKRAVEHPLVIVLAYGSEVHASEVESRFAQMDTIEQPDLMCVLRLGLVAGKKFTTRETPSDQFEASLVILQVRDENGARVGDVFLEKAKGKRPSDVTIRGRNYPVIVVDNGWACSDPARAFVLFLMGLTEALGDHVINPRPILRRYMPSEYDRIVGTSGIDDEVPPSNGKPTSESPST